MKIKVYLDMDGVLVGFEEGMVRKTTDMLRRVHAQLEKAGENLMARFPEELTHFKKKNAGSIEQDQVLNRFVRSLKGTPDGETAEAKAYKKLYNTERGVKAQIYATPGYYFDLKPTSDMMQLLTFVRTVDPNPSILTVPISGKPEAVEQCVVEKKEWVKKYMPDFSGEVICDDEKWKYAASSDPNTIHVLIDDRSKNTISWKEHGGIPILHTSAANSIAQLQQLVNEVNKTSEKLLERFVKGSS